MKRLVYTTITILLFLSTASLEASGGKASDSKTAAETNLLVGLQSDNFGLRVSSAYFLGELKSDKAIIPLMKMLNNESDERAQLMAALSLIKIEAERGIYLVKRTAEFDDNDRVSSMCKHLYKAYLAKDHKLINDEANTLYASLMK